jgi:probable HAF family extracellular repeat protein
MRRFLWLSLGVLLLAGVAVASSGGATQAEARWVITDLGTLPGGGFSEAVAINDRGQIVGESMVKGGIQHAFLWQNGKMRDLGTFGGKGSSATDINDHGQVVGEAETKAKTSEGGTITHGFLWQRGKMRDLGLFSPEDINNRGQIVGTAYTKSWRGHAALWEAGRMRDLGTFGGRSSHAVAINERGQVVGWWEEKPTKRNDFFPVHHGFLWQDGKMRDLGGVEVPSPGRMSTEPMDINERGQVVGTARWHPFLWQDGKMRDLGVLGKPMTEGEARGINERGQVVGASYSEEDEHGDRWFDRAFLWEKGTMIALPRLPGRANDINQTEANDINGKGWVVGEGGSDEWHALLWTLKP